jgi:hypothetical protein
MKLKHLTLSLSAVLAAVALAACGGSSDNGVASKSPMGILNAANKAIASASSVHIAGSFVTSSGTPITVDLHLVSGKGATGSVSSRGLLFKLINIGPTVYVNAGPNVWQTIANPTAAQVLAGKWLKTSATGNFAAFGKFTNLHSLLSAALASHGALTKGSTSTVHGQQVVAVRDASKGGTLFVATTGQPYPVEIQKAGSQKGAVLFDQYNQPVSLSAPSNAIDASKLGL